jgi:hypothetical protein
MNRLETVNADMVNVHVLVLCVAAESSNIGR